MQQYKDINKLLEEEYAYFCDQLRSAINSEELNTIVEIRYDYFLNEKMRAYFLDILQDDLLREFKLDKGAIITSDDKGFLMRCIPRNRAKLSRKCFEHSIAQKLIDKHEALNDLESKVKSIITVYDYNLSFEIEGMHQKYGVTLFNKIIELDEQIEWLSKGTPVITSMWNDSKKRWKRDIIELGDYISTRANVLK